MPRPGPRPYECVRRAWHSDRHQPMRGSLIQEIFRVANEVHSPATRQNKEWQEKLPFVVLKAEEIMYSKANSEAEYIDLKTLWDRARDAIDTIIRKDDTTESGDLLQPCIEAALNLGCIPRRASRSQRHSNPGCYLSSSKKDAPAVSSKAPDNNKAHPGSPACLLPSPPTDLINLQISASQFPSWHPAFLKPSNVIAGIAGVKSVQMTPQEPGDSFMFYNGEFSHLSKHSLLSFQDRVQIPRETYTRPSVGRVYPLFYSDSQDKAGIQEPLHIPQDPADNMLTAIMPALNVGETDMGSMQKFLGTRNSADAPNGVPNFVEASKNLPTMKCDLLLRLRPPSPLSLSPQSARANEVEDVGSSSSYNGSKFGDQSPSRARAQDSESLSSHSKDRCFGFFPIESIDEPPASCSSKWSSEGEGTLYVEGSCRKRKLPTRPFDDEHLCWKQKI